MTHEDISGVEEGMEEAKGAASKRKKGSTSRSSSASSSTKKRGTSSSTAKKRSSSKKDAKKSDKQAKKSDKQEKKGVNKEKSDNDKAATEEKGKGLISEKTVKDWKSFAVGGEDKEEKKKKDKPKPRKVSLYKKIAFTFILLTLVLLGVVVYFSTVNVSISVVPNKTRVSDNLIVNVEGQRDGQNNDKDTLSSNEAAGAVDVLNIKKTKTYQSSGERITGEEIVGEVRIINNYSQVQPLVASTRLLSPNDKLYRIEETVRVEPGGSATVEVYTEDPDPSMAIGPTEFTIPGLWAGLQDDIYAESVEGFEYKTQKEHFVHALLVLFQLLH